jgi:Tfp pilus assembly protein FimT
MLWVFAIASTPGLLAWPLVEQWMRGRGSAARAEPLRAALMRTSGALLALAAGWSLFHGIWKGSPEVC